MNGKGRGEFTGNGNDSYSKQKEVSTPDCKSILGFSLSRSGEINPSALKSKVRGAQQTAGTPLIY